jgi:hypothetical protein
MNLVIKCPLGLLDGISGSKVPLGLPVSIRHNSFPDTQTSFIVSFSDPRLPEAADISGHSLAPSLFLPFSELSLAGSMAAAQGLFGSKRIRPLLGAVHPRLLLLFKLPLHRFWFSSSSTSCFLPIVVVAVQGGHLNA